MISTRLRIGAVVGVLALGLTACGSDGGDSSAEAANGETTTIEIEDNDGTKTVTVPATSVVATDNRTFETLAAWDVPLSAAAVSLMPNTISYKTDSSIVDLGSHRSPDLEAVVAAEPDLIINGQRFTQYQPDFEKLAPNATIIALDPREGEDFASELKRQTTVLGQIFQKEDEAQELNDALDESIARAQAAYNADDTVMGVITSGGNINYSAPSTGRTIGPIFDILELTPSLTVEDASTNHEGDDISVEAIAASNPSIIIAMDRDGGTSTGADAEGYVPAAELIANSEALQNVTAVREGAIIYLPADTYTNESIQTYTEFFNSLADALEARNSSNN